MDIIECKFMPRTVGRVMQCSEAHGAPWSTIFRVQGLQSTQRKHGVEQRGASGGNVCTSFPSSALSSLPTSPCSFFFLQFPWTHTNQENWGAKGRCSPHRVVLWCNSPKCIVQLAAFQPLPYTHSRPPSHSTSAYGLIPPLSGTKQWPLITCILASVQS